MGRNNPLRVCEKVMEQLQLINAFMKLISKAGGGNLIRDLIQKVDTNGNPKAWTYTETTEAVHYVNRQIENFDQEDALQVIRTLLRKYDIHPDQLSSSIGSDTEQLPNVQGLQ